MQETGARSQEKIEKLKAKDRRQEKTNTGIEIQTEINLNQ
jgi:hypothetical protein